MTMHFRKIFDQFPVLRSFAEAEILKMLSNTKTVSFKAGSMIFEELQPCKAFPFVLEGKIRVVKRAENGSEISLYNVTAGDVCPCSTKSGSLKGSLSIWRGTNH